MVKLCPLMLGVWVQFLVTELRPHMLCGKKKQNIKQKQYCNKLNKDIKWSTSKKRNLKKNCGLDNSLFWGLSHILGYLEVY